MAVAKGGYNNTTLFALSEDHSALYQVNSTTLLPASTPVLATAKGHKIITLNQKFSTAIGYDASNLPTFTIDTDQYSKQVFTLCDTYKVIGAGGGGGGSNYENAAPESGVAADGSGSSARDFVSIHYGPVVDGEMEVLVTVNSLDPTSGSTTWSDGGKNKPTIKLNAAKAKSEITVPAELFDETIVTIPETDVVIAKGDTYVRLWLSPAAV